MSGRTHALRVVGALALATLMTLVSVGRTAVAVHESTNTLVFEAVDGSGSLVAGDGVIEYRGGGEIDSRWTVQLRFRGLAAGARHVAVVQGRYGAAGEPRGDEFDELCSFQASTTGEGGCWWYLVRMQQVNVVQLRLESVGGEPIAQATRAKGGPGTIVSLPNAFSPPDDGAVASPGVSPGATPDTSPAPVAIGPVG